MLTSLVSTLAGYPQCQAFMEWLAAEHDGPGASSSGYNNDTTRQSMPLRLIRKKRRALVLLLLQYFLLADDIERENQLARACIIIELTTRRPKTQRLTLAPVGPLLFEREYAELAPEGFRRRYRVSQNQFNDLLQRCEATQYWRNVAPRDTSKTHIPAMLWLAMVLDQLGTGCTSRTVSHKHGVNEGLYSRKRQHVLQSIVSALQEGPGSDSTRLGWPDIDDTEAWKRLAAEFVPSFDARCVAFYGTVAAGDGTLIPIRLTDVDETYRESFRSRKVCLGGVGG